MNKDVVFADFMKRIEHYRDVYETIDESYEHGFSYIKIFDQGVRFLVNRVAGEWCWGRTVRDSA